MLTSQESEKKCSQLYIRVPRSCKSIVSCQMAAKECQSPNSTRSFFFSISGLDVLIKVLNEYHFIIFYIGDECSILQIVRCISDIQCD